MAPTERGDGPFIVVENHQHARLALGGLGEAFEGHSCPETCIPNEGDRPWILLAGRGAPAAPFGEAKGERNCGAGMASSQQVVLGFLAVAETGKASRLAKSFEAGLAAGENLVGIALVPDIEHDAVAAEIKDRMQSRHEFDNAEVAAQMAPGLMHRTHQEITHFGAKAFQFIHVQTLEVLGRFQVGKTKGSHRQRWRRWVVRSSRTAFRWDG